MSKSLQHSILNKFKLFKVIAHDSSLLRFMNLKQNDGKEYFDFNRRCKQRVQQVNF